MFWKNWLIVVSVNVSLFVLAFTLGSDSWRAKRSKRYRIFFKDLKDFKELARLQNRSLWDSDSCIIYPDFRKQEIEEVLRYYPPYYTPDMYLNLYILNRGIGEDSKLDLDCRLMAARHLFEYKYDSFIFQRHAISRGDLEEYLKSHGEKV